MSEVGPNMKTQAVRCEQNVPHILVVDDCVETRLMVALRLQREGYVISTAGSGPEALSLVRHDGLPNLIVLDTVMPGMDGFAVAEELHVMGDTPLIFMSALANSSADAERIRRCAQDYVTKPFAFCELSTRVQRVLSRTPSHEVTDVEAVVDERLRINFARQYALIKNDKVALTPTESRLLHTLYNHLAASCRRAT